MLERNLSKLAEGIETHIWQKTLETTGHRYDQLTITSCAGAWQHSAWA